MAFGGKRISPLHPRTDPDLCPHSIL